MASGREQRWKEVYVYESVLAACCALRVRVNLFMFCCTFRNFALLRQKSRRYNKAGCDEGKKLRSNTLTHAHNRVCVARSYGTSPRSV